MRDASSTEPLAVADPLATCVERAIACIGREFPNHPQTLLTSPSDLQSPRVQTPAFFGCFDWHSAVHAHWLLIRMLRLRPDADWAEHARETISDGLTESSLRAECRYLSKPGREGFERPYGLAWLLQLAAELRLSPEPGAPSMISAISPLESLCRQRLADWLPKLRHPIRTGEHNQTAFAMGLAHDWASVVGDMQFARLIQTRAQAFYGLDRDLPVTFEPSGHDFLSPALAEVDLMRRIMPQPEFLDWLGAALPIVALEQLRPVVSADRTDGKLAHLDGLNLSRAWMLAAIAAAVGSASEYALTLNQAAERHRLAGQAAITSEYYAGTHWLGTFYVYDATRGLAMNNSA